jgi:hypothetical protein
MPVCVSPVEYVEDSKQFYVKKTDQITHLLWIMFKTEDNVPAGN